ncbi:uncharacterized protein N7483_007382 [Penicillium malachiteum]|uniref:uncharacterized protein n=1 Tax=Penicillium malachiteum TaxID=1324776 RepID=UPI0025465D1E|nr:uncharacterized protein N7483_007382 [Penicillium malachiteum]KAJ5726025.1 hypothetical protein N7483_007382 [Penicillium malachiteum]
MNSGTPISAVKRRACVACTVAKARCTPQVANICQRCARLGKSCTFLDLPQTRRKQKATPSRVEVLEKKVDQLVSQLATLTRPNEQISPNTSNTLTDDLELSREAQQEPTDVASMLEAAKDPSHGVDPPTSSVLEGQPSIVDRGLLSEAEAERLIMSFQFGFFREREPFLFLCVVAATIGSTHPLRKTIAEEVMNHVTMRIVARSERNLELLRGLLVYSAWYTYPAERHHPRLLLLIQLCFSILYDLALHKKSSTNLDEQRAVLGTHWLSAGLCGVLGRPSTMKHDNRVDEWQLSDRWISPFIELQSFLGTMDQVHTSVHASGGRALVQVTHSSLQRQFDNIKADVEKSLSDCPPSTVNAIRTEIKYAEMRVEEFCFREELWIADPVNPIRITMLMNMIQRSKELIQTIINLPASEIIQITITTSARVCAALGYIPTAVLSLLTILTRHNGSATDDQVQAVVDAADYPNIVTELADALEIRFAQLSAQERETDVVGSLCSKMRLLARCYPYQVRGVVGSLHSQDARQSVSSVVAHNDEMATTPEVWPPVYEEFGEIFPMDDLQWDSLLSDFTGF